MITMILLSLLALWVGIIVVILGGFAYWIVIFIQVLQLPDHAFRAAGTEKLTWGLIVGLTSWIGALIWRFGPAGRVKAAAAASPAPPGWYPTPAGPLFFDGYRWLPPPTARWAWPPGDQDMRP